MRFLDEATIRIQSGCGGAGRVSFRRAKFVPKGGPDGGDGGKGGDVIFVTDPGLSTLLDFRYKREYYAKNGEPGGTQLKSGASSSDLKIRVPVGTILRDHKTGEVFVDLANPHQEFVALKGGRGGKGNHFFKRATVQAPQRAQHGEPSQAKEITLELKLLADVGLIGLPNAGKSTLISRISNSKPKIADYPFTTLVPQLGVVKGEEGKSFVVADIPGLIKGSHEGAGLGLQFLKHVERTKLFLHLIDVFEKDPLKRFQEINEELKLYSPKLLKKKQIVVLTKTDLLKSLRPLPSLLQKFNALGYPALAISAVQGKGLKELIMNTYQEFRSLS